MADNSNIDFLLQLKQDLIDFVNSTMDAAVSAFELSGGEIKSIDVPLLGHTNFFKGRKPTAVIFSDGRECIVSKWKCVAQAILEDCISDSSCRTRLLMLREKVSGKSRIILSADPTAMDSPIEISDGLFMESKFDTETLLKVLIDRVLTPAGYDVTGISIRIKL